MKKDEEEIEEDVVEEMDGDVEIDDDALEDLVLDDEDGSFERKRVLNHILSNPEKEVSLRERWGLPVKNLEEDLPEQTGLNDEDEEKEIEYEIFKLGDENKYDVKMDTANARQNFDDDEDTLDKQKRLYSPIKEMTRQEDSIKYVKPDSFDKHYLSKKKFGSEQ